MSEQTEDVPEVVPPSERRDLDHGPVTTTHASNGAGRPRMILSVNEASAGLAAGAPERELALDEDSTSFGGQPGSDHVLEGLVPLHAEVLRDERDEFRIFDRSGGFTTVDGRVADGVSLHTGDRVSMGEWTMSFYREEFADHGRPYGGRQGGELSHDTPQPSRPNDPSAPLPADDHTEV